MIKKLKELSVNVSIDDFGKGYSSLSYLTKLKLDKIKIDRSFIQNLDRDEENNIVVKTVISLAKNLQLSIIAEGVEKQEHISFLHRHQCYYMQGYYFSKPVCRKEAEHLLEHWNKQGC
jgi:EAL domain-containing protein (putative c-di-GMP-specific phosphodiesterase class I)